MTCGTLGLNTATVKMKGPDGILRISTGTGTGDFAHYHLRFPQRQHLSAVGPGSSTVHPSFTFPCSTNFCCAGPVDAAYKAVDALVGVAVELEDYTINRWGNLCMALRGRDVMQPAPQYQDEAVVRHGSCLLCTLSVTEGIEALAVTRVIVRPTGALARQGIVKNAQVLLRT